MAPTAVAAIGAAPMRRDRRTPCRRRAQCHVRARPRPMDAAVTGPSESPPREQEHGHGPLAEEAAKLAEAFAGWVSTGVAGSLLNGTGESETCRVCPVCQLLRLVPGGRPEVYQHLADASASLMAAVRAAVEPSRWSWGAGGSPAPAR